MKSKRPGWLVVLLMCSALSLQSCYYDVEEELYPNDMCDTTAVTFSGSIQPILARNCTTCHTGASANAGVDLSTHAGAATVALNGRLVGAVTHAAGFAPMPQGASKLSECNINQIKIWVESGAPNN